jgi:replicative DNA helicase
MNVSAEFFTIPPPEPRPDEEFEELDGEVIVEDEVIEVDEPLPAALPPAEKPIDAISPDRALIYAVLQGGPQAYFKARDKGLRPEHVQDAEHRVYKLFESFAKRGRLPTPFEIKSAVGVDITIPSEPFDLELFAEKVLKRSLYKLLRDELNPIVHDVMGKDPRRARDMLIDVIRKSSWSIGGVSSYSDPAAARSVLDGYERAKAAGGGLLGLSSPWPNVDKYSLGLQPGELTVILAKRKVGKSWILFKWFLHILKKDLKPGECVFLVSMEMPTELIYRRLAAIDLGLCYSDFRAGRLTIESEKRLNDWVEAAMTPDPTKPTIYVAGPNQIRDVSDIAAKTAELNPRAVGVDGLYILGRDAKLGMWERTLKNVTETKLDLCAQLNMPVVATTQLKGSKSKDDLKADADDAAYAKAIGDYADSMRGVHMDDALEKAKQRIFTGMESREFQPVDLAIQFNLDTMNFDEIKVYEAGYKKEEDAKAKEAEEAKKAAEEGKGVIIAGTPPKPGEKTEIDF